MKTYGAGNGPTDKWFIEAIKDAIARGVVIVNVSQCASGMVMPKRYKAGYDLYEAGVVPGHDMTSEAAITKLMYLFGQGKSPEEVKTAMEHSIVGEMEGEEE